MRRDFYNKYSNHTQSYGNKMKGEFTDMAVLDEIKEAEQQAQKIKDDAKTAARSDAEVIESEAKKKGEDMKADARKAAKAELDESKARAERVTLDAKAKSDAACEALKKSAEPGFEKAVAFIMEKALDI